LPKQRTTRMAPIEQKTHVPPESSAIECCWEIPRLLECSRGQRPRGLSFKAGLEGLEAADSKSKGIEVQEGFYRVT
jgi:hypothetical protein